MEKRDIARVRRKVWAHYKTHGRHDLPWRKTTNPYRILVSEVMLQQTQVARVLPKYRSFLKRFPTVRTLAQAPLRDVLVLWSGLGYNRRAKMLHVATQQVVGTHNGRIPRTHEALITLPGVGSYTASAVCVFAYNQPLGMLETNIRTVIFKYFFEDRTDVRDAELLRVTEALCDTKKPREWYWALMDFGAYLKEQGVQLNSKSKHYTKQTKFEGSDRQIRGRILRLLTEENFLTERELAVKGNVARKRIGAQLAKLVAEGLVRKAPGGFSI